MSYLDWKVGDKVVCVKRINPAVRIPNAVYPHYQGVYTIREIRDDNRKDGALTVLLSEIDNAHFIGVRLKGAFGYREPGFPHTGFRPVQTRKTSIAIFTAMLDSAKRSVRA